jgi:diacylglycerol O-acyltransferase
VLAQCLTDALDELLETTVGAAGRRQPTRKATAAAKRAAERRARTRKATPRKAPTRKVESS